MSRILFVDDEPNVLDAFRRSIGRSFKIETATGGAAALELIDGSAPFAVIVSDMRMPQMDGIQFICTARQKSPDSVFLMLTGNADQQTAVDAVNRGQVFRFLNKPVAQNALETTLRAALRQHELITAERQLVEKTLMGAVRVLGEVLSLSHPSVSARCQRVRMIVGHMVQKLGLPEAWRYELAAELSSVGYLVLPPSLTSKCNDGTLLSDEERKILDSYPGISSRLIAHVPRLEETAQMIAALNDSGGALPGELSDINSRVTVGAGLLRAAFDLDAQLSGGHRLEAGLGLLQRRAPAHDPRLLAALDDVSTEPYGNSARQLRNVSCAQLRSGMITEQEIRSSTHKLLVAVGIELTQPLIERLQALHHLGQLSEPIAVFCPPAPSPG